MASRRIWKAHRPGRLRTYFDSVPQGVRHVGRLGTKCLPVGIHPAVALRSLL